MNAPLELDIRRFAWSGEAEPLFSDLRLRLPRGRITRLRGPSGCGKSTLLALLAGELPASTPGCVVDLGETALPAVHGRSSQDPFLHLLTTTVLDELLLGPEFREPTWEAAVDHALATAKRFGLEPMLANPIDRLSFGQARYLGLAGMWQYPPELLLLDEPLTGLDIAHRERVLHAMNSLAESGVTILATEAGIEPGEDVFLLPAGVSANHPSPPPSLTPADDPQPLVLRGLRWAGGPAAASLDLELNRGELAIVTGPNGSGKTQLLRCLAGLAEPSAGSVNGSASRAFVPQHPDQELFAPDVLAELTLGRSDRRPDAEALARYLGLERHLETSPLLLSYGEKRRVSLAGALARHPAILLLDEPLGGLDQTNRSRISALLSAWLAAGGRIVAATHEPGWFEAFPHTRIDLENMR
ncbi:MAG TPA: ATP-binding cassette domain-containing protein [Candidatus Ozemobacteraceae bacterium]|nr:ATP-binding cassette domain-containing protein [Candidatus Ozemobacteraceae bacterium]HQG28918.1 ATP-binding cassette domain-containing protein [Candidatus Ozemobacteraceae bacterium]